MAKQNRSQAESERRFEALVRASAQVVWVTNGHGEAEEDSATWREFTGQTYEQCEGFGWMDALHPDDRGRVAQACQAHGRPGEPIQIEYRIRHRSGEWRWLLGRAAPILAEDGSVSEWIGMNTDITERKRGDMLLTEQTRVLELIASDLPMEQCLAALTNAVSQLHPDARAAVLLADPSRTRMERVFSSTIPSTFGAGIVGLPINDELIGTCGRAIFKAELVTCANISESEIWSQPWKQLCTAHGVAACHSTPVVGMDGRGLASFALCFGTAREPDEWERRLGAFGAHIASIVIERDKERRQLDAELAGAKLLQRAATELVREESAGSMYETILDAAVAVMRSDFASMQMFCPEQGSGGSLRLLASRGLPENAARFWEWIRMDSHSTCGEAFRTAKRSLVADVQQCKFMAGTEDLATYLQAGIRAVQSTPLISRTGKLVGMLSTHWRTPHTPSERDLRLLDILARQAADQVERRTVEEALRESAEQFRQMANNIAPLAWMANPDGSIFWYNERWYEYTGTTLEIMQGWGWETVHDPKELPRVLSRWRHSLETGEPWEDTFPLRGKNGQYRWFLSRAFPIHNAHGQIVRWFGTNMDITDLRNAQQDLEDAARRKDAFLAMLAHELRNPLAPVRNAALILKRGARGRLSPAEDRACEIIERQVSHMTRLIDDLLDVSRIARGKVVLKVELFEITSLVESVVEDHRPSVEGQGSNLTFSMHRPLFTEGDRTRIAQVISNLLQNAIKFTPPGGDIAVSVFQHRNTVHVSVSDTGAGFSPRLAEHIFEPFVQADNSLHRTKGGLGLGLALVKGIVELHRGQVFGQSRGEGQGAVFEISLPLAVQQESQSTANPAPSVPLLSKRILIIEDNKDSAEMLEMLFSLVGCGTKTAHDGIEGLTAILSFMPDIVLCDIGLPRMNGYQIAEETRKRPELDEIRLIAMSGYGQEEDVKRALEAGFNAHLTKPVDPNHLLRLVSET